MKGILSFGGVVCLLESTVMSALFDKTSAAIAFLALGAVLTILSVWMEDREIKRRWEKEQSERLHKYQRRYQGDDMEDAG